MTIILGKVYQYGRKKQANNKLLSNVGKTENNHVERVLQDQQVRFECYQFFQKLQQQFSQKMQ